MDGFTSQHDHGILTIHNQQITVPYNEHTGLPLVFTVSGCNRYQAFLSTAMQTLDPAICIKGNLTPSQRVKLILHERCNHVNMKQLNQWIRHGYLNVDKAIANSPDPICIMCQFGKGHKRSHLSPIGPIMDDITGPGHGVSADQMEAAYPGRIPTTRGLPTPKRYKFVNIWVDNYTKYIYPTFHETKDLASMLSSEKEFEAFAAKYGITIQAIRADNGVYASGGFQADCDAKCQRLTFCAVGGHWQNGVAECHIGHITSTACTLLLHVMASWPGTVTEEFWPFAFRHACTFHNASIRNDTRQSPHHMFMGSPAPWRLEDFRVFGSPAFVLAKRLQDGDTLQKWKSRCWLSIYVGHSLVHSGNVPIIYNLMTTHVSPQFHIVHDDQFTTVSKPISTMSDAFYQTLYEKATWLYESPIKASLEDMYTFDTYWSGPPLMQNERKLLGSNLKQPKSMLEEQHLKELNTLSKRPLAEEFQHQSKNKRIKHSNDLKMDTSMLVHSDENSSRKDPSTVDHDLPFSNTLKPNLIMTNTPSAAFLQWQQDHGVHASVYSATLPSLINLGHETNDDPFPPTVA